MSLADRAKTIVPADQRVTGCAFGRLIGGLSETERVAFDHLARSVASLTELSNLLRDEGYRHDRTTLIRHMRGECTCESK